MAQLRSLRVNDHQVVRRGIALLLELEAGLHRVGEAAPALQSIEQAQVHRPDIVLLNLTLLGMRGQQAAPAESGTGGAYGCAAGAV